MWGVSSQLRVNEKMGSYDATTKLTRNFIKFFILLLENYKENILQINNKNEMLITSLKYIIIVEYLKKYHLFGFKYFN